MAQPLKPPLKHRVRIVINLVLVTLYVLTDGHSQNTNCKRQNISYSYRSKLSI